ncbi:MAG: YitT family protein [Clostridia bacterium]|nr:YitT family protein [Clostridia bacterium]
MTLPPIQPKVILKNVALTVLGTLLLSLATAMFILPYQLVVGGISGLAILINALIPLGDQAWITIVTVALYLLGVLFLGKSFAIKTLISTLVYPLGVALFSLVVSPDVLGGIFYLPMSEYAEIGVLLAAIFGGILTGAGCALAFIGGGSTGGVDVITLVVCKYFKRIKSSVMFFVVDASIILGGLFLSGSMVIVLLGIISAFMAALMVDKVFLGQSRAFIAQIVSKEHEAINRAIIDEIDRTSTVVSVNGGYTGAPYQMLIVTFTMNEYAALLSIVSRNDKDAFVTIHPAHEINGEGFSRAK